VRFDVTTWSLEMTDRAQLCPAPAPDLEVDLVQARNPSPELGRFLYSAVGGSWYWIDRLAWTDEQWAERLAAVETWVADVDGRPAGYYELDPAVAGEVEIAYFGLLPAFIGRGLGGWLLSRRSSAPGSSLRGGSGYTPCTLDAPPALRNYQARGMRIFKEGTVIQELPDWPPGGGLDA
jgi:GNAT superfamily N-acetyltransferase